VPLALRRTIHLGGEIRPPLQTGGPTLYGIYVY